MRNRVRVTTFAFDTTDFPHVVLQRGEKFRKSANLILGDSTKALDEKTIALRQLRQHFATDQQIENGMDSLIDQQAKLIVRAMLQKSEQDLSSLRLQASEKVFSLALTMRGNLQKSTDDTDVRAKSEERLCAQINGEIYRLAAKAIENDFEPYYIDAQEITKPSMNYFCMELCEKIRDFIESFQKQDPRVFAGSEINKILLRLMSSELRNLMQHKAQEAVALCQRQPDLSERMKQRIVFLFDVLDAIFPVSSHLEEIAHFKEKLFSEIEENFYQYYLARTKEIIKDAIAESHLRVDTVCAEQIHALRDGVIQSVKPLQEALSRSGHYRSRTTIKTEELFYAEIKPIYAGMVEAVADETVARYVFLGAGMTERDIVYLRQKIKENVKKIEHAFKKQNDGSFNANLEFFCSSKGVMQMQVRLGEKIALAARACMDSVIQGGRYITRSDVRRFLIDYCGIVNEVFDEENENNEQRLLRGLIEGYFTVQVERDLKAAFDHLLNSLNSASVVLFSVRQETRLAENISSEQIQTQTRYHAIFSSMVCAGEVDAGRRRDEFTLDGCRSYLPFAVRALFLKPYPNLGAAGRAFDLIAAALVACEQNRDLLFCEPKENEEDRAPECALRLLSAKLAELRAKEKRDANPQKMALQHILAELHYRQVVYAIRAENKHFYSTPGSGLFRSIFSVGSKSDATQAMILFVMELLAKIDHPDAVVVLSLPNSAAAKNGALGDVRKKIEAVQKTLMDSHRPALGGVRSF